MIRPSKHEYFMAIAQVVASRSTCLRRAVGAVLVDHHDFIVATGYNGIVSGATHCEDSPCPAVRSPSGHDLDRCFAIHAEVNAVSQCDNVKTIKTAYVTTQPCVSCTKLLLTTGCEEVIFVEPYDSNGLELWLSYGRRYLQMDSFSLDALVQTSLMDRAIACANATFST